MNSFILFGIFCQVIISTVNGSLEFCWEFGSKSVLESQGNFDNVPALLTDIGKEIKTELRNVIGELKGTNETMEYKVFHFDFSHPAVTLYGNFSNGILLINDQADIKLWTMKEGGLEIFNVTLPYIFLNGSYYLDGYVGAHGLFDVYGDGSFHVGLTNISISAITGLFVNSSELCIPFKIEVYLKDYEGNFLNLMNGDEELNDLLNGVFHAIIPEAVSIIFDEMRDGVEPFLQAIIDKIFHGPTLSKLLKVLSVNQNELGLALNGAWNNFY